MEELLGRQAPHSATAEQAVIGSMLIDTRCIPDVIERLRGAESSRTEIYLKRSMPCSPTGRPSTPSRSLTR